MTMPTSASSGAQSLYLTYDRERRLYLIRTIAGLSWALEGTFVLLLTIFAAIQARQGAFNTQHGSALELRNVLLICWPLNLSFGIAAWLASRNRVDEAVNVFIAACVVAETALLIIIWGGVHYTPLAIGLFLPIVLVIMLASALGDQRLLIIVSSFFFLLTLVLFLIPLMLGAVTALGEAVPFGILALVQVMTFASLLAIVQRTYQKTLRDLGNTQIAYDRALRLDALKDQFIMSVNHELRNPVMAMLGHLDILEMRLQATPGADQLQPKVAQALRAAFALRALINTMLEAEHYDMRAAQVDPAALEARHVIQEAIELVDPQEGGFATRSLQIAIAPEVMVWGSRVPVLQILTNLLSNAAKYSAPTTPIAITATVVHDPQEATTKWRRAAPATPPMAEIRIRDWGLGIPPEEQSLLFQRFVRLPRDLASTVPGNGLGLYLCQQLAERMGGRITIESTGKQGDGSTFVVRLPVPPPSIERIA